MLTTTLSAKGQIVIPKSVRNSHGWIPGTEFELEDSGQSLILKPVSKRKKTRHISELAGFLKSKYKGPPVSIEDMNKAIELAVKERHERGRY